MSLLARVFLSLTAVAMPASTVEVPSNSFETGPGQAITPPGAFFAIWGVVILGCLAMAIVSWWRYDSAVFRVVAWPLAVAQAGFCVWLICAGFRSTSVTAAAIGTIATFALILASLLVAMSRLRGVVGSPRWLVAGTVGLYAGWSSAAIWLNVVTCLPASLADSVIVQSLGIVGAALTVALIVVRFQPYPTYVVAVVWALAGIAISAASFQAWVPLVLAVLGICVVVVVWVARGRQSAPVTRGV
jgi:hypothetical protein